MLATVAAVVVVVTVAVAAILILILVTIVTSNMIEHLVNLIISLITPKRLLHLGTSTRHLGQCKRRISVYLRNYLVRISK